MLRDLQSGFRAALLERDGGSATDRVLPTLRDGRIAAKERLKVYRMNVQISLAETIVNAFPATARIAGLGNLRFAARSFACAKPPREARLLAYGADFPAWLAQDFAPAKEQPWLAEVARLEWAMNEALFAESADPLDPAHVGAVDPEALMTLRFQPHPASRLVRSALPIHSLWSAAQDERLDGLDPAALLAEEAGESVLVTCPGWSVALTKLTAADASFTAALFDGRTLAEAAEAALEKDPELDLQALLLGHLTQGSFRAVSGQ